MEQVKLDRVIELLESIDLKLGALVAGDKAASAKLRLMINPPIPDPAHATVAEQPSSESRNPSIEQERKSKGSVGNRL